MSKRFKKIYQEFSSGENISNGKKELYMEIRKTQQGWRTAKNIFNNSTDPDQIDYSIYLLEVYEKKLKILYKQVKETDKEE